MLDDKDTFGGEPLFEGFISAVYSASLYPSKRPLQQLKHILIKHQDVFDREFAKLGLLPETATREGIVLKPLFLRK